MYRISKAVSLFIVSLLLFGVLSALSSCKKNEERQSVKLTFVFDDENSIITGKAVYKFVNSTNEAVKTVPFNLFANAYNEKNRALRKTYDDGYLNENSFGGIKINECLYNGKTAAYNLSDDELSLEVITGDLFPSEIAEITLGFTTTIPQAKLRLGKTENTVNLGDFYPVLCKMQADGFYKCGYNPFGDPYFADASDYFVEISVPSKYVVAASGFPEKTLIDNERTTYSYSLGGGRDFAFVLSDKYNVSSEKCGDVDLYYYSLTENNKNIETVKRCFEFFCDKFGKYPHKTFSVAETDFAAGGMEYSGLTMLSDDLDEETLLLATVHETAHQWWHSAVGVNEVEDAYIDEGLCEYSTYLYLLENGMEKQAEEMITNAKALYKSFFEVNKVLNGSTDTVMSKGLSEFKNQNEYVAIAYGKSLIMFCELEKTTGKSKAISCLKKFYNGNMFKTAGLNELIKAFGHKEYFESYVNGKVVI